MKNSIGVAAFATIMWSLCMTSTIAAAAPVTDFAARKTQVMDFLTKLKTDNRTLAGTQVNEYEEFLRCNSMDRLVDMTGTEPALLGLELMFAKEYRGYEDALVHQAVEHTKRGGLVTMSWHERNPLQVCVRGEHYDCTRSKMSDDEFDRMLTPGTAENALWVSDVAALAKTLQRLQNAGVIVLFRPYHEMNGAWFWWGQKKAFPRLWDALYEQLENKHALRNLIWVWSGDRAVPDAKTYWPVQHPTAIVGSDVYEENSDSPLFYDGAKNFAAIDPHAMFAYTEIGHLPSDAAMSATHPLWVLLWGGEYLNAEWSTTQPCTQCNTPDAMRTFFAKPRMMSLAQMPLDIKTELAGGKPHSAPQHPKCAAKLL